MHSIYLVTFLEISLSFFQGSRSEPNVLFLICLMVSFLGHRTGYVTHRGHYKMKPRSILLTTLFTDCKTMAIEHSARLGSKAQGSGTPFKSHTSGAWGTHRIRSSHKLAFSSSCLREVSGKSTVEDGCERASHRQTPLQFTEVLRQADQH